MPPVLVGGFLSTVPPRKSYIAITFALNNYYFKKIKNKKKVFYMYPHIYHVAHSSLLCINPNFHNVSFSSA